MPKASGVFIAYRALRLRSYGSQTRVQSFGTASRMTWEAGTRTNSPDHKGLTDQTACLPSCSKVPGQLPRSYEWRTVVRKGQIVIKSMLPHLSTFQQMASVPNDLSEFVLVRLW